eukprot:5405946-Prymnesium_polylepis.1
MKYSCRGPLHCRETCRERGVGGATIALRSRYAARSRRCLNVCFWAKSYIFAAVGCVGRGGVFWTEARRGARICGVFVTVLTPSRVGARGCPG